MRIIFLGTGGFAQPTLRWLADSEHEVALVLTQPARASGRGRHVCRTPVGQLCEELGFTILEAPDVNEPEIVARLESLEAGLGMVIDFGQKIGPELLAALPGGCINLHASLLPKYRGAAPINWAIAQGAERTGCTVFRITERWDAGPILTSRWTAIKPEETAGELHDRLAAIGVDAVSSALELYADGVYPQGTPQDDAQATRAPKLTKADGVIRFDQPAAAVACHIRAMTPWPGARARYQAAGGRFEDVAIARARVAEGNLPPADPAQSKVEGPRSKVQGPESKVEGPRSKVEGQESYVTARSSTVPGTIDARRYVAAGGGFVEIMEIKPSSGRLMSWQDYVNGRHVGEGDMFVALNR